MTEINLDPEGAIKFHVEHKTNANQYFNVSNVYGMRYFYHNGNQYDTTFTVIETPGLTKLKWEIGATKTYSDVIVKARQTEFIKIIY